MAIGACLRSQEPSGETGTQDWDPAAHAVATRHGQLALQVNPEHWQHLQSPHFVVHSANRGIAARTAEEAEHYLLKVFESLELKDFEPKRKSHIFIFEEEEGWREFSKVATLDPWTGGFFDGLDLFYRRKTGIGVLHSDATLPHEIAHCALYFKFPFGAIPLALNEGFAEHQSRRLAFQYLRPRGYDVREISRRVPRDKFIPVEQLLSVVQYPEGKEKVGIFYTISARLVNFMIEKHGMVKFRELLEAIAQGRAASGAVAKVYANDYISLDEFARKFEEYAIEGESK